MRANLSRISGRVSEQDKGDLGRSILVQDKGPTAKWPPFHPQSPAMLGFFRVLKPQSVLTI